MGRVVHEKQQVSGYMVGVREVDEQVQIPASGGKCGSYVTPTNLSNSRTSLILCSEQREKREHMLCQATCGLFSLMQPEGFANPMDFSLFKP